MYLFRYTGILCKTNAIPISDYVHVDALSMVGWTGFNMDSPTIVGNLREECNIQWTSTTSFVDVKKKKKNNHIVAHIPC
jgi:hypothetical protein